jgi:hypothetical protein
LERWNAGSLIRRGHAVLPTPVVRRHHLDLDAGLAVQPRNVATQTEDSIIYALGHVPRERITIRNGRVLDSGRRFDPATPRSGELTISPYDSGDDGCRSADDQRTIFRPKPIFYNSRSTLTICYLYAPWRSQCGLRLHVSC